MENSEDGNISIIDIADDDDTDIEEVAEEDSNIRIPHGSVPSGVPFIPFQNPSDGPITITIPDPTSGRSIRDAAFREFITLPEAYRHAVTHPLYIPATPPTYHQTGANRYVVTPPLYIPPTPLRGANLYGAISPRGAEASGANFFGATPRGAEAGGANLFGVTPPRGAGVGGANLFGATPLHGAGVDGANLYGATPPSNTLNVTVDLTDSPVAAAASPEEGSPSATPPASPFSCPVCLDNLPQIRSSGKHMMSTVCGHIFCSQCLASCFRSNGRCPTCRKSLLSKDMHQIFV